MKGISAAPGPLTVAQANARLDEIEVRRSQLVAALAQTGTSLAEAEATLGEAVLNGDESAVRQVADLRLRVDGFNAALAALEKRRDVAVREKRRAEAADLREGAKRKRDELEALEKKTTRLLAQLSELEGVGYEAGILSSQRTGQWYPHQGGMTPAAHLGLLEVAFDPTNAEPVAVPRSRLLRKEAADLDSQADEIERECAPVVSEVVKETQQPPMEGTLSGEQPERSILDPTRINTPGAGSWYRG